MSISRRFSEQCSQVVILILQESFRCDSRSQNLISSTPHPSGQVTDRCTQWSEFRCDDRSRASKDGHALLRSNVWLQCSILPGAFCLLSTRSKRGISDNFWKPLWWECPSIRWQPLFSSYLMMRPIVWSARNLSRCPTRSGENVDFRHYKGITQPRGQYIGRRTQEPLKGLICISKSLW